MTSVSLSISKPDIEPNSIFYGSEIVPAYLFNKFDQNHTHPPQTGNILHINTSPKKLVVIDIDYKLLPENTKNTLRTQILSELDKINEEKVIVQTAHGGLHIYATFKDLILKNQNRFVAVSKNECYAIDMFFSLPVAQKSNVVFPPSFVRDNEFSQVLSYSFLRGDHNSVSVPDVNTIVDHLSNVIDIKGVKDLLIELSHEPRIVKKKERKFPPFATIKLGEALIDGLIGIKISTSLKNQIRMKYL